MNEFKTCDKCRGFDSEELIKRLKEIDSNANIVVACQSMCAIGAKKARKQQAEIENYKAIEISERDDIIHLLL